MKELSPESSYANGLVMYQLDYKLSPFANQNKWDENVSFVTMPNPICFDHG
jgi:hypothetical protein